jgi:hypothetical protein
MRSLRVFLAQATGSLRPLFDIRPQPDECAAQLEDGWREVGMPAAPVVDEVRSLDAKALGNFCRAHQIIDVHLSAHGPRLEDPGTSRLRSIVGTCTLR